MSDTEVLLHRIAALRHRLEEAKGPPAPKPIAPELQLFADLQRHVNLGTAHNTLLDATLRQLPETAPVGGSHIGITHLTSRARRVLERGRSLLAGVRALGDALDETKAAGFDIGEDPLAQHYHDISAMTNTSLRIFQAFPETPSAQLRLSEGLESILKLIDQRLAAVTGLAERRHREINQAVRLAELLESLALEIDFDIKPFLAIADEVLAAASEDLPIRMLHATPAQPALAVACHSLNVAQVTARLLKFDQELRAQPLAPVLAALLHDVGMIRVPVDILTGVRPLDDKARRVLEGHCQMGASVAAQLLPGSAWLVEAVAAHHERLDGTGYPNGLRELQLTPLVRLLAVCDVYVALASPRPHRPARDSRTALTDTLLLAEQGKLDRIQAEHLLQLSFYPSGTVVELANGNLAVVLAAHNTHGDLNAPARPVVAILTDRQGRPLPLPRYLDLARCEGHSIVRTLSLEESRPLLAKHYPEFV